MRSEKEIKSSFPIKVFVGDDIRRFILTELTFDHLINHVIRIYPELPTADNDKPAFDFKYVDDDNELITICSTSDLLEAICVMESMNLKILKLRVFLKPQATEAKVETQVEDEDSFVDVSPAVVQDQNTAKVIPEDEKNTTSASPDHEHKENLHSSTTWADFANPNSEFFQSWLRFLPLFANRLAEMELEESDDIGDIFATMLDENEPTLFAHPWVQANLSRIRQLLNTFRGYSSWFRSAVSYFISALPQFIEQIPYFITQLPDFDFETTMNPFVEVWANLSHHFQQNDGQEQPQVPIDTIGSNVAANNDTGIGVHNGVSCDGCSICPIVGIRYKCCICPDTDMCEKCENAEVHKQHPLIKITHPDIWKAKGEGRKCWGRNKGLRGWRKGRWKCQEGNDGVAYQQQQGYQWRAQQPRRTSDTGIHIANWMARMVGEHSERPNQTEGYEKPKARFVRDVNIMDGTIVAPNQHLNKLWEMCNVGNSVWPEDTKLVHHSGYYLQENNLPQSIAHAGETVHISLPFTAPSIPGRYKSVFRLFANSVGYFGHSIWVDFFVEATEEGTSITTSASNSIDSTIAAKSNVTTNATVSSVNQPLQQQQESVPSAPYDNENKDKPIHEEKKIEADSSSVDNNSEQVELDRMKVKYTNELAQLEAMKLGDDDINVYMLKRFRGSVARVADWYMQNINN